MLRVERRERQSSVRGQAHAPAGVGREVRQEALVLFLYARVSSLRVLHLLRIPRKCPCQDQGISDREQDQSGKMQKPRLHCTRSRQRAQPASTVLPD